MAFTHLHVHTEYSLLDGAARISTVVSRAKELGMDALAITDHGVMFGVVDFYKECRKQGIHPVIGCETYLAARTLSDKDPDHDKVSSHLILLAENDEGYHNLVRLISIACTQGFYYKPRVDKEILRKYHTGIIATSACMAGRIQRRLLARDYDGARREAQDMLEIFGPDHFYLEVQNQGLPEEKRLNEDLFRLSEELGIPVVATNDVHYTKRSDAEAHDVLLAIQTATSIHDPGRMKFPNDQFYLKSEEEMRALFPDHPEVIENTEKIAKRCQVTFEFGKYHLPPYQPPEGKTNSQYLRELCESGLKERYSTVTEELRARMEYELSVIESMGFVEYFLIVWDFIHFARENGIAVGPGRGSAAGSIVAYCLHITNIDPIRYGLIFERFLNPARVSMPDIDVDFCIERRGEVIDYVKRKYGEENVSQIITFGRLKARLAVRDVGRALDLSYAETDKIAKMIPAGPKVTLKSALETSPDLREMVESDPKVRKVIEMAQALEGMPRHASTHAAGVVICGKPVDEYVPLYLTNRGPATQFNMTTIEELGLLKMDFLGLRNLTVIRDALDQIRLGGGPEIDFDSMPDDDPEVYRMISEGGTAGVFQLESQGMTEFMKNLKPTCFEDIIAGIALYRPGPMDSIPKYIANKQDPSKIRYVTPELAPILDVTYGCIIYQEQVMQIVRDLAGYDYGRSDLVRRAMSKKKVDVMNEEKQYFIYGKDREDGSVEIEGCIRRGISEQAAEQIFADMQSFAEYAFNKSHATAYAVLAYQTAYLKRYYPKEFLTALISSVLSDSKQVAKYIRACRARGIRVLPPDVNRSMGKFTVEGDAIRFGLLGVKNVGQEVIDAIIEARETKGEPHDIFEFISGLDPARVNKKAVESLIRAGALDSLNPNRAAHLAVYEELMNSAQSDARRNVAGQLSLFQMNTEEMRAGSSRGTLPNVKNFDRQTLLQMEREMLGVYLSGHPLDEYEDEIRRLVTMTSVELSQPEGEEEEEAPGYGAAAGSQVHSLDGRRVTMAGMITGKRNLVTKNERMMAFVEIEDLYGPFEVIVFPNVYDRCHELLEDDRVVVVRGTLNVREGEDAKVLADTVTDIRRPGPRIEDAGQGRSREAGQNRGPEAERNRSASPGPKGKTGRPGGAVLSGAAVKIRIPEDADEQAVLRAISRLIREFPGGRPVRIYRKDGRQVRPGGGAGLSMTGAARSRILELVGSENLKE